MRCNTFVRRIAVVAASFVALQAAPADAAAPPNDTRADATAIAPGFTQSLDTTQATTDAGDADLLADCGTPIRFIVDATVWYTYTPTADTVLSVTARDSDYDARVMVATGPPADTHLIGACNTSDGKSWVARAGTTYTILVLDGQFDGGANGGTLNLEVVGAPLPKVSFDPVARVDQRSGVATVTGTGSCPGFHDAAIRFTVGQFMGRLQVFGRDGAALVCDGATHPFSVTVVPSSGKFAGGPATVDAEISGCMVFEFHCFRASAGVTQVRLKAAK